MSGREGLVWLDAVVVRAEDGRFSARARGVPRALRGRCVDREGRRLSLEAGDRVVVLVETDRMGAPRLCRAVATAERVRA